VKPAQPTRGVLLIRAIAPLTIGSSLGGLPPQLDGVCEQHARQSKSIHRIFRGQLGPKRLLCLGLWSPYAGHAIERSVD
jgi:hypothetical protein